MATKTTKKTDSGASEATEDQSPKAEAGKHEGLVKLRSRHRLYRVRDVPFENFTALVTQEKFDQLKTLPGFGQGFDFWRDDQTAGEN